MATGAACATSVKSKIVTIVGRYFTALLFTCGLAWGALGQVTRQDSSTDLKEAEELSKRVVELRAASRYREAIPLAERLLTIRERQLGPDHLDVGVSLGDLASLYHQRGDYTHA